MMTKKLLSWWLKTKQRRFPASNSWSHFRRPLVDDKRHIKKARKWLQPVKKASPAAVPRSSSEIPHTRRMKNVQTRIIEAAPSILIQQPASLEDTFTCWVAPTCSSAAHRRRTLRSCDSVWVKTCHVCFCRHVNSDTFVFTSSLIS